MTVRRNIFWLVVLTPVVWIAAFTWAACIAPSADHVAPTSKMLAPTGQTAPRYATPWPNEKVLAISRQLCDGHSVTVDGPVVLGANATLKGFARGASHLTIRMAGSGKAIHAIQPDIDIADLTITVEGLADYGLRPDRQKKEWAAHGLRVRDVAISGQFRKAALGIQAAEVGVYDGCAFANKYPGEACIEVTGMRGRVLESMSNLRFRDCSIRVDANTRCLIRLGTGVHDIAFRDCEIAVNGDLEACFLVGDDVYALGFPADPNTWAWDVIGHVVIDGGHWETAFGDGRGCTTFMKRLGRTAMRDLTMRDFHAFHLSEPFEGFDVAPVGDVWFHKFERAP